LLWKVFDIQTGKILRAGFESEDEAKDWLELKSDDLQENYEVEEMDPDEEEEWRERLASGELDEDVDEDEEVSPPMTFGDEYYDGDDLAEDDLPLIEDDEADDDI
jgi:hypothetical protein